MIFSISLDYENNYVHWADQAREAFARGIPPENLIWRAPSSEVSLFEDADEIWLPRPLSPPKAAVPKAFPSLAKRVICHSDPERFARLYRILWRLQSEKRLLEKSADPDIVWLTQADKAIRRDRHKMHAFVRFRKTGERELPSGEIREQFVSWFEPEHYILELSVPFFVKRFTNMDWAIITPHASAFWNGSKLLIGSGGRKDDINVSDDCESLWKTYFASTFNPARLKVGAMMAEMPKKYWHNLPEAELIPDLIAKAQGRSKDMQTRAVTAPNPLAAKLKNRA